MLFDDIVSKVINKPLTKFFDIILGLFQSKISKAIERGDLEAFKREVKKNININKADEHGTTLLMMAACNKNTDIVRYLLDNGALVNMKEIHMGATALHYAIKFGGKLESVKLLLERGASCNEKTSDGETPLMHAIVSHREDIVKVLLEDKNINIEEKDLDGCTAWGYALKSKQPEINSLLKKKGACENTQIPSYVLLEDVK